MECSLAGAGSGQCTRAPEVWSACELASTGESLRDRSPEPLGRSLAVRCVGSVQGRVLRIGKGNLTENRYTPPLLSMSKELFIMQLQGSGNFTCTRLRHGANGAGGPQGRMQRRRLPGRNPKRTLSIEGSAGLGQAAIFPAISLQWTN